MGLPIFERFFAKIVERCQEAGLVWGKELIFDATQVRANADYDSLTPRFHLKAKEHVAELFAGDIPEATVAAPAAEDHYGPEREQPEAMSELGNATAEPTTPTPPPDSAAAPTALPFAGTPEQEAQLAAANEAQWRLLDEHRLDPERAAVNSYQRITDLRVSTTDPDATPMSHGGKPALGYHDHYVVDGGKQRIILAAFVTPADVMENRPMLDLLRRVQFRYHLHPKRAIADTTYGTAENIKALEDAGIRAYVPLPDFTTRTGFYGIDRFTYDADRDVYRCPQGELLRPRKTAYSKNAVVYQANAASCNACPLKAECTEAEHGRVVQRPLKSAYLDRVRGYHETEPYRKAMRKRQVWVEPLFGEAKEWHHLRQFRLRSLAKVNIEGQLIAAGQNLKRWLKATGWGRRTVPGEAVLASFAFLFKARHSLSTNTDYLSAH